MLNLNVKVVQRPINNRVSRFCFKIVQSNKFEFFILFVIVMNTVFLCLTYVNPPAILTRILDNGNILFVSIYAAEATIKIIAVGMKVYWHENWNKFDLIIILASIISLDQRLFSFNLAALRIIRVARLLRVVKVSKGLRYLLKTLYLSLANVLNVGALLFLIYYTFTIAGMELFGNLQFGENITQNANFTTFYLSMMTLVRCSTGENWNEIMHESEPQVGSIAVFYWCFFELLTYFVFLNIFVAVIYESFDEIMSAEDTNQVLTLQRKDLKAFLISWSRFDPAGTKYIKTQQLMSFLRDLPPPMGFRGIRMEPIQLLRIINCLNIRDHQGKVYFPEALWSIFHSIMGVNDKKVHRCKQVQDIIKLLKSKYHGLPINITSDALCGNTVFKTEMTASKYLCALQIVNNWRRYKHQASQNVTLGGSVNALIKGIRQRNQFAEVIKLVKTQNAFIKKNDLEEDKFLKMINLEINEKYKPKKNRLDLIQKTSKAQKNEDFEISDSQSQSIMVKKVSNEQSNNEEMKFNDKEDSFQSSLQQIKSPVGDANQQDQDEDDNNSQSLQSVTSERMSTKMIRDYKLRLAEGEQSFDFNTLKGKAFQKQFYTEEGDHNIPKIMAMQQQQPGISESMSEILDDSVQDLKNISMHQNEISIINEINKAGSNQDENDGDI